MDKEDDTSIAPAVREDEGPIAGGCCGMLLAGSVAAAEGGAALGIAAPDEDGAGPVAEPVVAKAIV